MRGTTTSSRRGSQRAIYGSVHVKAPNLVATWSDFQNCIMSYLISLVDTTDVLNLWKWMNRSLNYFSNCIILIIRCKPVGLFQKLSNHFAFGLWLYQYNAYAVGNQLFIFYMNTNCAIVWQFFNDIAGIINKILQYNWTGWNIFLIIIQ